MMNRHRPPFVHRNNTNMSSYISMPRWALKKSEPETLPFWCETCDRGFKTQYILDNHKSQHEKCNIDGCQFIAHPKVVTKHIQMQHSTGLYKKIAKLQDPEEIKKWREERKKKYPTKVNIEKKEAERKEKIERGEKMGLSYSRHNRKPDLGHKRKSNEPTNTRQNLPRTYKKPRRNQLPDLPIKEDTRLLKPFTGIQHLLLEDDDSHDEGETKNMDIIDDEWIENKDNETIEPSTIVCGALSALIGDYGSSDEDEKNESSVVIPNAVGNKSPIVNPSKTKNDLINRENPEIVVSHTNSSDDDNGPPEETTILKTNSNPIPESSNKSAEPKKSVNRPKFNNRRHEVVKRHIPSTLLQKLLKDEIRHERNIVLQCVHYVVNKKYFSGLNKI